MREFLINFAILAPLAIVIAELFPALTNTFEINILKTVIKSVLLIIFYLIILFATDFNDKRCIDAIILVIINLIAAAVIAKVQYDKMK